MPASSSSSFPCRCRVCVLLLCCRVMVGVAGGINVVDCEHMRWSDMCVWYAYEKSPLNKYLAEQAAYIACPRVCLCVCVFCAFVSWACLHTYDLWPCRPSIKRTSVISRFPHSPPLLERNEEKQTQARSSNVCVSYLFTSCIRGACVFVVSLCIILFQQQSVRGFHARARKQNETNHAVLDTAQITHLPA